MTTLPLSDVKARFSELADAIEATLEFLRDPAAQRRVAEAEAEIARGEWLDEDEVRAMLRRSRATRFA